MRVCRSMSDSIYLADDSPLRVTTSHPKARHRVSRDLGMGAKSSPASEKVLPQRNSPGRGCCVMHEARERSMAGQARHDQQDLLSVLPDLVQCLCNQAHWGERILAQTLGTAVCHGIHTKWSFGQGIPQSVVGGLLGSEQIYLCCCCTIEVTQNVTGTLASCEMPHERIPPWQFMYATIAMLSVRTNTCLRWINGIQCPNLSWTRLL